MLEKHPNRKKDISHLNRVSRNIEHSELTDEQIAKLEGCKYQAVQCSVKAALKAIKKFMK